MTFIRRRGLDLCWEVEWRQQRFNGLANVGFIGTFLPEQNGKGKRASLEVHILCSNRSIYGEEIQVIFKRRIRDEVRFESSSLLIEQIKKDIRWAQENVFPPPPRKWGGFAPVNESTCPIGPTLILFNSSWAYPSQEK